MMEIRINHPGDGDWIMDRVEGVFRPGVDHSIANHRDGVIVGGFVCANYLGNSIALHQAGEDPRWCSRKLLAVVFRYCFRQLGVQKVVAPVPSDNAHALHLCLRCGFQVETMVRDLIKPGVHLMILTMEAKSCPWLHIPLQ